ncbi:hypothetical protein R6Q59_006140 [Mikania micrantha]
MKNRVVESLKEKEVRNNNEETCQTSHEVFDSALGDDIDDTIVDLCLEIYKHRQRWIESEDEEDPVDLGKVDKTIKADPIVNKSNEPDLSCPSFSLGFTQTLAKKKDVEQSGNTGYKASVDKQEIDLNQELLNEDLSSFSLGLTQECNQEGSNQLKEILVEKNSTNAPKKEVDTKRGQQSEILAEKAGSNAQKQAEDDRKGGQQSGSKLVGRTKAERQLDIRLSYINAYILAEKYGTSGTLNQGLDAPRSRVLGGQKQTHVDSIYIVADILAERNKVIAELEAKKVVSKNTSKHDSIKEGIIEPKVGKEEASKAFHERSHVMSTKQTILSPFTKKKPFMRQTSFKHACVFNVFIETRKETGEDQQREVIFETSNGAITEARFFKTLLPGNKIYGEIIDCWAAVLNEEEKLRSPDSRYCLFYGHRVFKHMFVKYLEKFQLVKADKMSMQKVTRVDLEWAMIGNITDCGVFAMRHMEMFMGSNRKTFDCGFKASESM